MSIEALQSLGLSREEAQTYVSLLKLGGTNAIALARDVGVKRTSIYPLLKALTRKGFATVDFLGSRRVYAAQKPQKIVRHFEKKIESFEELIPQLPILEKIAPVSGLRFIETPEELKNFYFDILEEYKGKSYDIIGSSPDWESAIPNFLIHYRRERAKAKIKSRILLTAESKETTPRDPSLLRMIRYLPAKHTFKSTIDIYNDKILIVSPKLSSAAVVIGIPAMVDIFKSIFEIIWDSSLENRAKTWKE